VRHLSFDRPSFDSRVHIPTLGSDIGKKLEGPKKS
jgi:hypothetical protein